MAAKADELFDIPFIRKVAFSRSLFDFCKHSIQLIFDVSQAHPCFLRNNCGAIHEE
jgi:hypothetical protein